jgi:hypothetical protein
VEQFEMEQQIFYSSSEGISAASFCHQVAALVFPGCSAVLSKKNFFINDRETLQDRMDVPGVIF